MSHPKSAIPFLFALVACCASAFAQQPANQKSEAKAEARAEARSDGGGSKTHSVTHRVVVVNGKTVVDERTENGRPVDKGAAPRRRGRGRPAPAGGDARETLRRMKEQLERDLGRELPLGGFDEPLPKPGKKAKKATSRRADATSGKKSAPRRGRLQPRRKLR